MNQNNYEIRVIGKHLTVDDAILIVGIQHFVDWRPKNSLASMESLGGAKKLDKNDSEFQVRMLAMKTEVGRITNHAAAST
jgi:hypothetical protein